MNMASVCVARFGQVGRRTAVKLMVVGAVGLMSLAGANPALAAGDDQASFWTQFTPSVDTRLIFVSSSSGNDSNSGLTPATPVKTLTRAESLLRDGYPDWMLLKRGDVWLEGLPYWSKSGRSESERMVVGAYGDAAERPQIRPGPTSSALRAQGANDTSHIAFVGLHLEPQERADGQAPLGVVWYRRTTDVLFEDLLVKGFKDNFNFQQLSDAAPVHGIKINGCIVVDAWASSSHAQGLYAANIDGLTIENCVFDGNGFNQPRGIAPTIFNHNIYLQTSNNNVLVKNNIISNASASGIHFRAGGRLEGNLFIKNPISVSIGGGNTTRPGGVTVQVLDNLIVEGKDISTGEPRGWGIGVKNIKNGRIAGNIIANLETTSDGWAMMLADPIFGSAGVGIIDLSIENNWIIDWGSSVRIVAPGPDQIYRNIVFSRNHFARFDTSDPPSLMNIFTQMGDRVRFVNNHYSHAGVSANVFSVQDSSISNSEWVSNYEPTAIISTIANDQQSRSLMTGYMSSIGHDGGSLDFISAARKSSRQYPIEWILPSSVYRWATTQFVPNN